MDESTTALNEILELTTALRTSDEPLFARLRFLLPSHDIDPRTTYLVELFPDDTNFEFGVLVATDGRIYQFGFDYLNCKISEGLLAEWRDLTLGNIEPLYSAKVLLGLDLLRAAT